MALKQVWLAAKIADKRTQMQPLLEKREEIKARRAQMRKREEELEEAVQEITEETEEEAKAAVEQAVAEFEAEVEAVDQEEKENGEAISALEEAIEELQGELDEIAAKVDAAAQQVVGELQEEDELQETKKERKETKNMNNRTMFGTVQQRTAIFARDDVKQFAQRVRQMGKEKRAINGGELLIPEILLPMIREQVEENSKLLKYVNFQSVKGTAREPIMGSIPEAVWTEVCANLNEINLSFSEVEVDGYKVGAFIPVCNALLEDNDVTLVSHILFALARGIAIAVDKAILYGTGTKMPLGIVTRLAQQSEPANYPIDARPWEDLHTSNIKTISAADSTGIALFKNLVDAFGNAKKKHGSGGKFWAMSEKTHTKLIAEAMVFSAAGAIVAGMENTMPVVGGPIEELDFIPDGDIIAGYGEEYLAAERGGIAISNSEHFLFTSDKTVFKANARYDGKPAIAEGFVLIGLNNVSPTTTMNFALDKANEVDSIRMNTATVSVKVGEKVQLRAITEPGKGTVTWASATEAKATVSSDGEVTGVAAGSSVITATCNGKTAQCTVTVTAA